MAHLASPAAARPSALANAREPAPPAYHYLPAAAPSTICWLQLCPTRSIWTIDLAHLLAVCGACVQLLTITIGANQVGHPWAPSAPPDVAFFLSFPVLRCAALHHASAAGTTLPEALAHSPYHCLLHNTAHGALQAYSGERFYAETMLDDSQRVDQLFQVIRLLSAACSICAFSCCVKLPAECIGGSSVAKGGMGWAWHSKQRR